jgi:uncharacterized protein (DUF433 family)
MSIVDDAERLLARMSPAEKAQLMQTVARDLDGAFPGIEHRPGVAGGAACIARTRIPVWVLEQARRLGTREADLLLAYPSLHAEDLVNAWAYVRVHRDEIDSDIEENESA